MSQVDLDVEDQKILDAWPNSGNRPDFELKPFNIDGSSGEGGGQILRITLAVAGSLVGGRRYHITNIRAGRPRPGLSVQHLQCVHSTAALTGIYVFPAKKGSTELYIDSDVEQTITKLKSNYTVDTQTAGSLSLIVQAILPILIYTGAKELYSATPKQFPYVTLRGGTNVPFSPPLDHVRLVLLPLLERHCGAKARLNIKRRGYYPKGGGEASLKVGTDMQEQQDGTTPIRLERQGKVIAAHIVLSGVLDEKKEWAEKVVFILEDQLCVRFNREVSRSFDVDVTCTLAPDTADPNHRVRDVMVRNVFSNAEDTAQEQARDGEDSRRGRGRGRGGRGGRQRGGRRRGDAGREGEKKGGDGWGRDKPQGEGFDELGVKRQRHARLGHKDSCLGLQLVVTTDTGCILHMDELQTGRTVTGETLAPMLRDVLDRMGDLLTSGATVDEYTADQLLIYMAFSFGESVMIAPPKAHTSSDHLETAIDLIEAIVKPPAGFQVDILPNGCRKIRCFEGTGLSRDFGKHRGDVPPGLQTALNRARLGHEDWEEELKVFRANRTNLRSVPGAVGERMRYVIKKKEEFCEVNAEDTVEL